MTRRPGPIVAAVLLPPLGTYLAKGPGRDFWITTGLTVLGFLPGIAYALWSMLHDPAGPAAEPATPAAA
jgi:uncharacterized membrane protein YqaE (UPF0057 family)